MINSGEGGFITSDDPEMMAKAIYLSGAYEARYKHHIAAPDAALCAAAPPRDSPSSPAPTAKGENRPGPRRRAGSPPAGAARRRPRPRFPPIRRRRRPLGAAPPFAPPTPAAPRPSPHPQLQDAMMKMPNLSSRMSELTAAVLRPLIANLPERVVKYNER